MRFLLAILFFATLGLMPVHSASKPEGVNRQPNRLLNAASPYLRQHAYNPINWYEWGEEAFEKAKKENKPVFLSVGYSTCHWCHVMERESFSDERIADILNSSYVAIKVDRERRPDVDETYMLATQLITGGGGWPNSVFMTPERKPFFAGTYFPPKDFRRIISQVSGMWIREGERLKEDAERLSGAIDTIMTRRIEAAQITPDVLKKAADGLMNSYDIIYGGFGNAPKFPQESLLLFLLHMADKDGYKDALDTVEFTLESILGGGIHDHVAGGFHRYSVDEKWRVPHFEKMLYNQAFVTQAMLRAYRLTGNEFLAKGARRALDYVLDDLTDPKGGFYSARDADSEGEEGTFYVWSKSRIEEVLDEADAKFAKTAFGITEKGNFEHATNVLHYPKAPTDLSKELGVSKEEFDTRIDAIRSKLAAARDKREHPIRDDKIVAAWNGMMIATFAEAADIFDDVRYRESAIKAGTFLWENLQKDGRMARTWFEGKAPLDGQQEDYAFTARGFIALYDLTGDRQWLERAELLVAEMVKQFRDEEAGDYFMTASVSTFNKAKARTDAGTPSGNAVALEVFAQLDQRTRTPTHRVNGEALLAALSGLAVQSPQSNAYTLMAADVFLRGQGGPRRYVSKGVVDARGRYDADAGEVVVTLRIEKGWHVNSNEPLEEFFVPTSLVLDGDEGAKISYPAHRTQKLGFHDKELALFEDKIVLKARPGKAPDGSVTARLSVQACSDKICLEPETVELRMPGVKKTGE